MKKSERFEKVVKHNENDDGWFWSFAIVCVFCGCMVATFASVLNYKPLYGGVWFFIGLFSMNAFRLWAGRVVYYRKVSK